MELLKRVVLSVVVGGFGWVVVRWWFVKAIVPFSNFVWGRAMRDPEHGDEFRRKLESHLEFVRAACYALVAMIVIAVLVS